MSSPTSSTSSEVHPPPSMKKESRKEVLSKPFQPFDVNTLTSAFDNESVQLSQFETEFNELLLSTILEIKAWALARPVAERDVTEDALANGIKDVQKSYEEQEQARLHLLKFISDIQFALAGLRAAVKL